MSDRTSVTPQQVRDEYHDGGSPARRPVSAWLESMRGARVDDVARALGVLVNKRTIATCPACGASRAAERSGKLPGHGGRGCGTTEDGKGWRCYACDASGDALDYVARSLRGRRFRDCAESERAEVRAWCQRFLGQSTARVVSHVEPRRTAPSAPSATTGGDAPRYPPAGELQRLWRATLRVDEVPAVADYLSNVRKIDPTTVADRGLARAIGSSTWLPRWARSKDGDWRESGHLIVLPLYDALGEARSVLARLVSVGAPKSLPPTGYQRKGLVMACPLARRMLRYGSHPSQWPVESSGTPLDLDTPWWPADEPLRLVICEGVPDFWCWATEHGDADAYAPATMSVDSGSWTQAHADRVPVGTHVTIATDRDDTGDKYAAQIKRTFKGRSDLVGRVRRWRAA